MFIPQGWSSLVINITMRREVAALVQAVRFTGRGVYGPAGPFPISGNGPVFGMLTQTATFDGKGHAWLQKGLRPSCMLVVDTVDVESIALENANATGTAVVFDPPARLFHRAAHCFYVLPCSMDIKSTQGFCSSVDYDWVIKGGVPGTQVTGVEFTRNGFRFNGWSEEKTITYGKHYMDEAWEKKCF